MAAHSTSTASFPASTGERAHHTPNRNQVNAIIDRAKAAGQCSPVLEGVWRAIGETDIGALEALAANTPANPALSATPANPKLAFDVCYAADRCIDSLLNPIITKLMASRYTMAAFNEAAMTHDAASKMHWPSLMDALEIVTPNDDDMDAAVTQIYAVIEAAVQQALQGAAAAVAASATPASSDAASKQTAPRKRGKLVAKSPEVV